jgi:hypothetical protein
MIGSKRIFFLAAPVIFMLGSTPHFAIAQQFTTGGAQLPAGWTLKQSDKFGSSGPFRNGNDLRTHYCEGVYYDVNRANPCYVKIPNSVINNQQQTYVHFEDAIDFTSSTDHLTIMAGPSSKYPQFPVISAEMVAQYTPINFCIEARYRIPNSKGSWPSFWFYGSNSRSFGDRRRTPDKCGRKQC